MLSRRSQAKSKNRPFALWVVLNSLLILSLSCSLPGLFEREKEKGTETPPPTAQVATPIPAIETPQPLPPAIIERDPAPEAELPLDGKITLFFNQPMERASVETALSMEPAEAAEFAWADDATLSFRPAAPLSPESSLGVSLETTAQSQAGLTLTEPISFTYHTVGYLRLAQQLPEPGAQEVDPTSAVVAAFNRPVVPLGADPQDLPAAFTLIVDGQPETAGRTEWLNTSTYIFYPDPGLQGGKTYTVSINSDLQGSDGSPLPAEEMSWSFTTAKPRLLAVDPPGQPAALRLDANFTLTFNQPMNTTSVEANFNLLDPAGARVPGKISWNEDFSVLTFDPDALLARDTIYRLQLNGATQARGGTNLGSSTELSFRTYPTLKVTSSNPSPGGLKDPYGSVLVYFNAPLASTGNEKYLTFTPDVPNLYTYWNESLSALVLTGEFDPSASYTLRISPDLPDAWGTSLGQEFTLSFSTPPLEPTLFFSSGLEVIFLTGQDHSLSVQAASLTGAPIQVGSVPLVDFFTMLGQGGYEYRLNYKPANSIEWTQPISLTQTRLQTVELPISPSGESLVPGLYMLRFNLVQQNTPTTPFLLVVSDIHLTFKISATDALVWAVNLATGQPVSGAPLSIYAEDGSVLASGKTDEQGIFHSTVPPQLDPYRTSYAVLGQPGEANFSLALSSWNGGVSSWDFDIPSDYSAPQVKAYLYSDRPIYRPGQTIYFRAVVRQAYNGRYAMPSQENYTLALYNPLGEEIERFDLPLSAFGTGHGEYNLSPDAQPGEYRLASPEGDFTSSISIQVAEYRKPEINLQVTFDREAVVAGESLTAQVNARYFFDAPAGNLPVHWALYSAPAGFYLPGFQVGAEDTSWLDVFHFPNFGATLGEFVKEGEGQTSPDGTLSLELPPDLLQIEPGLARRFTLEVTAADESGQPVSARAAVAVHPAEYYIGVRPDSWSGRVGEETAIEVQVVDWAKNPAGVHNLRAEYRRVEWVEDSARQVEFGPQFVPQYTPVGSTNFATSAEGQARISFVPPVAGVYQVDISGLETSSAAGALTQALIWVGGPGQAVFPAIPNNRLRLTSDRDRYLPGDTAQVFIPNPLGVQAKALVTIERGIIQSYQTLTLEPNGSELPLTLSADDAPNIYLSVTLLKPWDGGRPDFRQGYLELVVDPVAEKLDVNVQASASRTGPGEEVGFEILVTDTAGEPVQGEFSFSVVDKAVLALADPNAPDILPAFYGEQPLGVRTGLGLAAYGHRELILPPGMGGGGESEPQVVRERFPDTAFWEAQIVTGPDGRAHVDVPLPDSLTTWRVDVRGLTADTRVGQAQVEVVTTKDLLVRPVTPRFFVQGDHALVAAVVQNNTGNSLRADVSLSTTGFTPDDPAVLSQTVEVPAGGRARVEWWGTVEAVDVVDLIFSATAGDLKDSARPAQGQLPVLSYTAPQAFRTSGILFEDKNEVLELVSLPRAARSSDGQAEVSGELQIELVPSLAAVVLSSLEALEAFPYESTEGTVSRFLPNLEAYRALQKMGAATPELQGRLEEALDEGLARLAARQNEDGGWGWWMGDESDPYISAYVVFGLSRAKEAGIVFPEKMLERGIEYLTASLPALGMLNIDPQFDRLAFELFALGAAGAHQPELLLQLYEMRGRLSPWAQAFLALALQASGTATESGSPAGTLLSDIQAAALRSATGAHWEAGQSQGNMVSTLTATAIVVYALAQRDPASPLLADAVRYLAAHRSPGRVWQSPYETAWILLALVQTIQGTGELAGNFTFRAALNEAVLADGQASGSGPMNVVTASAPASNLYPDYPNALRIQRDPGPGRLYYTAGLRVDLPAGEAAPLNRGASVSRQYFQAGEKGGEPISEAGTGDRIDVRLTLTLPQDTFHLMLEDWIPAGAEILDTSLKTSQQGQEGEFGDGASGEEEAPNGESRYDPSNPFEAGWGWWYFSQAQIFDERIVWAADYLPAGTYQLTYTLVMLQPGEYQVLPARAWQFYFPEVQGNSAGEWFEVTP